MLKGFISVVSVNQRKWDNCHLLIRSEGVRQEGEMVHVSTRCLVCIGVLAARRVLFIRFKEKVGGKERRETERKWHTQREAERKWFTCKKKWNWSVTIQTMKGKLVYLVGGSTSCLQTPAPATAILLLHWGNVLPWRFLLPLPTWNQQLARPTLESRSKHEGGYGEILHLHIIIFVIMHLFLLTYIWERSEESKSLSFRSCPAFLLDIWFLNYKMMKCK